MTRAMAVIVVAALCAALVGVDESLWAAQDDAARQQAMSTRVSRIDVGSVVKIERKDGRKIEGVLTAKTPDSITVDIYQRRAFRRPRLVRTDTISLDDVKEIKKPLSTAQVALITTGVVVGTCAALAVAAAASLDAKAELVGSTQSEQEPAASGTTEPSAAEQALPVTAP